MPPPGLCTHSCLHRERSCHPPSPLANSPSRSSGKGTGQDVLPLGSPSLLEPHQCHRSHCAIAHPGTVSPGRTRPPHPSATLRNQRTEGTLERGGRDTKGSQVETAEVAAAATLFPLETPPHFQDHTGCSSPGSGRGQRHLVGSGHSAPPPRRPSTHPRPQASGVEDSRAGPGAEGYPASQVGAARRRRRGRPWRLLCSSCLLPWAAHSRVAYARHMLFPSQHLQRACKQPAGGGRGRGRLGAGAAWLLSLASCGERLGAAEGREPTQLPPPFHLPVGKCQLHQGPSKGAKPVVIPHYRQPN